MSAADYDWGVSGDLLAQLREAEAKVSRARKLAEAWDALDGEPATSDDLTVLTVTNRHGRELLYALDGAS